MPKTHKARQGAGRIRDIDGCEGTELNFRVNVEKTGLRRYWLRTAEAD